MQVKPVRWSDLKWMRRSPAHYRYYRDHPVEETAAMRIGSLVHTLVLGAGREFVKFSGTRRGKAWESFQMDVDPGTTIVNEREADEAAAIAESVMANKEAMNMLTQESVEEQHEWLIGTRACHGTPDAWGAEWLADLKVTTDASPDRFPWHLRRMGWDGQLAWYYNGLDKIPSRVGIVAVENKPPYVVTPYEFSEAALEQGERVWRACWERLMVCEQSNHWPGYVESFAVLDGPPEEFSLVIDGEEVEL